jgi:hypothetical protein
MSSRTGAENIDEVNEQPVVVANAATPESAIQATV